MLIIPFQNWLIKQRSSWKCLKSSQMYAESNKHNHWLQKIFTLSYSNNKHFVVELVLILFIKRFKRTEFCSVTSCMWWYRQIFVPSIAELSTLLWDALIFLVLIAPSRNLTIKLPYLFLHNPPFWKDPGATNLSRISIAELNLLLGRL